MPVTIGEATSTLVILDDEFEHIHFEHVKGTWIWLIHKTARPVQQLGTMHVKLDPVNDCALVTLNDSGSFMEFPTRKITVDVARARSSPTAAQEELQKVRDLFQSVSDMVAPEEDDYLAGENDPSPRPYRAP